MYDLELQNALRLRREGRLAEAADLYGRILQTEPKHFDALHALGIVRYQSGQLEEAERLMAQALAIRPDAAEALYNRASVLARLGRGDEALAFFGRAIDAKPDYVEALTNRGVLLAQAGRFAEALGDFDRVVALRPGFAHIWRNRVSALEALGRPAEALAAVERLSELDRMDPGTVLKRADLLLQLNRTVEAEDAYGRYLAVVPYDAQAWNRRGIACAELKRKDDALTAFSRAVDLASSNPDFWNNRANALFEAKRFADAAADYAKALKLAPHLPYAEGYLLQCRMRLCEWEGLGELRANISRGLAEGARCIDPLSNLAVSASPEEQLTCARQWIDGQPPIAGAPFWRGETYGHKRIRIAYLSADYRLHPVAYLLAGVFEAHDRKDFEIAGVSFTPPGQNAMRARIEKACDRFLDVRDMTDAAAAALLREAEIDIAVDLMGFTDGCRPGILAARPAPVQVNYLGYPSTSGAPYMDYVLADETVIPEDDHRYFAEAVASLPDCYLPGDCARAIAESTPSRTEAGLPENRFVFASFNDAYKIAPEMFDVWMRLLREVEGSVLWLAQANPTTIANLRTEAVARRVSPDRLKFAAYVPAMEDHLARLKLADLMLDTLPYNAHASASDALWAGVPLVTCQGQTFAGRVAASALKAARLPELMTSSLAEYEALALKLAREPALLKTYRDRLTDNRAALPLFDTARFTRHLESVYRTMWERAERGQFPTAFMAPRAP